jgi:superfamily I DNA/RNA helicase
VFPIARDFRTFLDELGRSQSDLRLQQGVMALKPDTFDRDCVGMCRLPPDEPRPTKAAGIAVLEWWKHLLRRTKPSGLTFSMINRLAELILKENVTIVRAMQLAFPYVFLDEFQDTTEGQYSLVKTAFAGSASVLTAVGDNKQRIMVWAGAERDAFECFQKEFAAERISLLLNHRSAPDLVVIQARLARAIDPSAAVPQSKVARAVSGDAASIWEFSSRQREVHHVAAWLKEDMQLSTLQPRDYALLVRQKAEDYEAELAPALVSRGLRLRNESRKVGNVQIQDLLAEELTECVLPFLRLGCRRRSPADWAAAVETLAVLRGVMAGDERGGEHIQEELRRFVPALRQHMEAVPPSAQEASKTLESVLDFIGIGELRRAFPQYTTGERFDQVKSSLATLFGACATAAPTWAAALDRVVGFDEVPLMTIHKSKGLEFHTMLFIGLDDDAWWSSSRDEEEGLSSLFVALSRAKQRAIFSYCVTRGGRFKIAKVYQLLSDAGVRRESKG